MINNENRPGDDITGPAQNTHAINGADNQDTLRPYGLSCLDERERQFVTDLSALAVAVWVESARDDGNGEFRRPRQWQDAWAEHNDIRLAGFEVGRCLCANTGGRLVVIDVDPRNGGDLEAVRQWLSGLGVRIFADVITPSGGRHFYVDAAWREDFHTVHGKLPGMPGVDLQAKGANVFLPGTRRPKYDGKGYEIVTNDLAAIRSEGDHAGALALAEWLAEHAPRRTTAADPGKPWDGTPPDARQRAYLDAVLANGSREVAEAVEGTRNDTLNRVAFALGQYVGGAGLDCERAEVALLEAAERSGLSRDEAETSITSGMTAGMDNPRAVPERERPDPRDPLGTNRVRHAASSQRQDAAYAEAKFWAQRDILAHVLRFSRSRGAAPYAVLGAVLRRAIDKTDPSTQLPATVGDTASVNLFTVPVGRSGQGKDIANGVGRAAVEFVTPEGEVYEDPTPAVGIGSGEGLARIFRGYGSDDSPPPHVNLEVNEVGTLDALANRKGSTLIGELLKAYMGQALGFTNAQRSTTTFVLAHSYRLCLSIGAQPENAEFFLSREKDGLPQRFLFLPTVDPYAPPPDDSEPMQPARVVVPMFPAIITGTPYEIGVPSSVRAIIRTHRHRVLTGAPDVDPLDGHLMLTQLKVSFALALLESRRDISEDDWRIAGHLIEVSNRTRADMRATLADSSKRANIARAHAQADRQQVIDGRLVEDRQRRVANAIVRRLEREKRATKRELRKGVSAVIRGEFDAVLDTLLENGTVASYDGGYGLAS